MKEIEIQTAIDIEATDCEIEKNNLIFDVIQILQKCYPGCVAKDLDNRINFKLEFDTEFFNTLYHLRIFEIEKRRDGTIKVLGNIIEENYAAFIRLNKPEYHSEIPAIYNL